MMASNDSKFEGLGPVTLCLVDRLLDFQPKASVEPAMTYRKSLETLRSSLRRDLENLLNTRCAPEIGQSEYEELQRSVFCYGLPDITAMSANYLHDHERLLASVEEALKRFEPRLNPVKVSISTVKTPQRVLRFVIEGMLRVDPAPEHVVFDAALELMSGEYQVLGDVGAG
jgi:type VI secretion system protein ImpF